MARLFSTFVAVLAVTSQVYAAPMMRRADSAIGEVAVSASDGVVRSATEELAAEKTAEKMMEMATTTTAMAEETSKAMMEEKSTMMEEAATTTAMAEETPSYTYAAANSYETAAAAVSSGGASYGSGSNSWGGMGYNNCVQQCIAEFGSPAATYTAEASAETATATAKEGTGVTHTVIVAPTQGVLRFIPFAVNASVGDTISYVWGAGPHTVTKSAALTPCNASLDSTAFNSGKQNKSFVFNEVVNDTNPVFFYCGVATHCQKGMFGIINPPNGAVAAPSAGEATSAAASESGSAMTVKDYMMTMASNDSSMAALWGYVSNKTAGTSAENWGMAINMADMPESEWNQVAQNTMYTQLFYAANPGMLEAGKGASDVSGAGIVIPSDIPQVLSALSTPSTNNAAAGDVPAAAETASVSASAAAASGSSASSMSGTYGNGSGRLASSTALVGAFAILASFVML